ncbi:MAG: hypothetical protein V7638_4805 [Acidobacteriota bacterium]
MIMWEHTFERECLRSNLPIVTSYRLRFRVNTE